MPTESNAGENEEEKGDDSPKEETVNRATALWDSSKERSLRRRLQRILQTPIP